MKGLFAAFALGAAAGGTGAVVAARLTRAEDMRTRFEVAQAQVSAMLQETRAQVQGVWVTAAERAGAISGRLGREPATPSPTAPEGAVPPADGPSDTPPFAEAVAAAPATARFPASTPGD